MSNENHNNTGNWRSKLEALESVPGETVVDKNASWEKLHERLRVKKSGKKMIWYWAAAACLLLVLIIPFINSNKKNQQPAKNETVQKQPSIKPGLTISNDKKDLAQITKTAPVKRNRDFPVAEKGAGKYQRIVPATVTTINRIGDTVSIPGLMKETLVTAIQPLDTSLDIVLARPVNKKLKVVHINELGDPVEEFPGMAHNADAHSFKLKLASQEVYSGSSVAYRTDAFTIIKSKTSPN